MPRRERTPCIDLRRRSIVAIAIVGTLLVSCKGDREKEPSDAAQTPRTGPASTSGDTTTRFADDGQWVRPAKDYQGTRFSGLTEINNKNVQNLHVFGTFSLGTTRGVEAAPIVVGHNDVHRHALSQLRLRPRSDEGRDADEVVLQASSSQRLPRRRLLRCRQSRTRGRQRESDLQHARCAHHRARRGDAAKSSGSRKWATSISANP